jgi:hypothetical protein
MGDLLVLHNDNATFVDYSKDSRDYLRDNYSLTFIALEDEFYVGLHKPFNSFYVELQTVASTADLVFEINATSLSMDDDTRNLTRSGFMTFDKPTTWVKETINGIEAYWLKITSTADFTANIQGLNIVFADDNDLRQEVREIDKQLAAGDTSFIAYHLAARNEIIQTLRNGGMTKDSSGVVKHIEKWDILERGEIRQAAKYLALSKIFFDVSRNNDDKSYKRFRDYEAMFGKAFNLYIMHLDKDDDGINDVGSDLRINTIEIEIL